MSNKIMNVLFLCTGNSARSIMAEAILNKMGHGRFAAYSAGSHPAGRVNPLAINLLTRNLLSVESLRSKDWTEFAEPGAPVMDFVFTVCDKAAGEMCPIWPGQPMTAHWGVEDPVEAQGDDAARLKAFSDAFQVLNRRVSLLISLPIDKLERLSLQRALAEIGTS